jgi:hypothetical protein
MANSVRAASSGHAFAVCRRSKKSPEVHPEKALMTKARLPMQIR